MKKIAIVAVLVTSLLIASCSLFNPNSSFSTRRMIKEVDRDWTIRLATNYLSQTPVTVTAAQCERSLGGVHDFYSEGDYWWPDPKNPDGPYIRRDGMTNPDNFTAHRKAMRRMSIQVAILTGAYKLTGMEQYSKHAISHLRAWFIDPETLMNPHMKFAQAIKGRVPGRGVGLIDGIHLVEVARSISFLHDKKQLSDDDFTVMQKWFADFLTFMTTHEYGIDERERNNNHGTCWVMQAAEYACLTGNSDVLDYCRERFKTVILPGQMAADGSFPKELARTKPYGYSLFNIDIMSAVCHILSTADDNLWDFKLGDGRGMHKGMEYITPFIADKSTWPLEPDVMYWDEWPSRHIALLFAGAAYNEQHYKDLWKSLPALPETDEGLRNFPIRVPILWF